MLDNVGRRSFVKYISFAKLLATLCIRFANSKRDDIVYTTIAPHGEALLRDALVIAAGRLVGRRVIIHMHTRGVDEVIVGTSPINRFTTWALTGAELVSQSSDVIDYIKGSDLFSRIHHLPNFVQDPGLPNFTNHQKLNLGFFGSFDQRKGVLRFIDVLATLKKANIPFHGHIAGRSTHDMTPEVVAGYAKNLGVLDDITIPGYLPDDDAIKLFLRQLDLFIYPTDHDLAPLVLLEAMSHGVVPIAFDTGAIREMLSPEFDEHVINNTHEKHVYSREFCSHIVRYHNDRALLVKDKHRARDTFLARHSLGTFERALGQIIMMPALKKEDSVKPETVRYRQQA